MHSTILYVSHTAIDKGKWDACIHHAINTLIYARSSYLDAMSPGWDALVYGDYEAVMPVTWRSKMGIRYVCQPAFAQQTGLFYPDKKYRELVPDFLKKLDMEFKLVEIFPNYDNVSDLLPTMHQNFILNLQEDYDTIYKSYKTDLLKNLKRTAKFELQYMQSDAVDEAIKVYQQYYAQRMHIRDKDFEWFTRLSNEYLATGNAFVREVRMTSGQLLSIALFLKDDKRIYNIASTTLPDGRTMEANHFLMDELIREFAGSGLLLDFEGSDLPGVARFYQKFSPASQPYSFWKSNRLPSVMHWWKK